MVALPRNNHPAHHSRLWPLGWVAAVSQTGGFGELRNLWPHENCWARHELGEISRPKLSRSNVIILTRKHDGSMSLLCCLDVQKTYPSQISFHFPLAHCFRGCRGRQERVEGKAMPPPPSGTADIDLMEPRSVGFLEVYTALSNCPIPTSIDNGRDRLQRQKSI